VRSSAHPESYSNLHAETGMEDILYIQFFKFYPEPLLSLSWEGLYNM